MEHQHRLATLRLRLTLLNTPRQAGFLRARPATDGEFDTYWAELRRDKRVYFFAHTAPQGSMPLFALELARVDMCSIVEVEGRSVGRPLIANAPLLQLAYAESGGKVQILSHALSFARGHRTGTGASLSCKPDRATSTVGERRDTAEATRQTSASAAARRATVLTGGAGIGGDGHGGAARVWQLMFPTDGQLSAWKHDIDRLMASNHMSLQPEWTPLKVWVGTWNAANLDPPFEHLPLAAWLLGEGGTPTCDLYAVGFQELGGGGALGGGGDATAKRMANIPEGVAAGGAPAGGDAPRMSRTRTKSRARHSARPPAESGSGGGGGGAVGVGGSGGGSGGCSGGVGGTSGAGSGGGGGGVGGVGNAGGGKPKHSEQAVLAAMAEALARVLGDDFTLVEAVPMYQIQVFVFVRVTHLHHASRVAVAQVPTFRAAYNNAGTHMTPKMLARRKGGVAITLSLGRTTFCFVTAHLAAHQGEKGQLLERNRDSVRILQNLLGDGRDACTCFDHLFFFGDLNYRLGPAELPDKVSASRPESTSYWNSVAADIQAANWQGLYERDQLRDQIAGGRAFYGFHDGGAPTFPPTFKIGPEKKAAKADGRAGTDAHRRGSVPMDSPSPSGASHVPRDAEGRVSFGADAVDVVGGVKTPLTTGTSTDDVKTLAELPYRQARIPSYCDRILALHGPATRASTRRVAQGDAPVLAEHSDHGPVWAHFQTAFLPHAPLPEELAFEDTWHLEIRALSVRIGIGKLRDADGGWGHMYGDRWLGAKPALHASIEANFLLRGSERLPAPRPPGTLVQGRGKDMELVARWERADMALSPLASRLGLAWLQTGDLAVHLHAGDATPHVPLGSSRFAIETIVSTPRASMGADPCTQEVDAVASLSYCGVYVGTVRIAFAFRMAASAPYDPAPQDVPRGVPLSKPAETKGAGEPASDRYGSVAAAPEGSVRGSVEARRPGSPGGRSSLRRVARLLMPSSRASTCQSVNSQVSCASQPSASPHRLATPTNAEAGAESSMGRASQELSTTALGSMSLPPAVTNSAPVTLRSDQSSPSADDRQSDAMVSHISFASLRGRLTRRRIPLPPPSISERASERATSEERAGGARDRAHTVCSTMPLPEHLAAVASGSFSGQGFSRGSSGGSGGSGGGEGTPTADGMQRGSSNARSSSGSTHAREPLGRHSSLFGSPSCALAYSFGGEPAAGATGLSVLEAAQRQSFLGMGYGAHNSRDFVWRHTSGQEGSGSVGHASRGGSTDGGRSDDDADRAADETASNAADDADELQDGETDDDDEEDDSEDEQDAAGDGVSPRLWVAAQRQASHLEAGGSTEDMLNLDSLLLGMPREKPPTPGIA